MDRGNGHPVVADEAAPRRIIISPGMPEAVLADIQVHEEPNGVARGKEEALCLTASTC